MGYELPPTDFTQSLPRGPRLNLAIGPNCPVRCEGCYNNFGDTYSNGGLVLAEELVDFASNVRAMEIDGVTLSGGDPLFHPEIEDIITGLDELGFRIKVDTVGTSLLGETKIAYKGKGEVPFVDIQEVKDKVESITIPLDGVDQETISKFRKGRKNLLEETKTIAKLLQETGVTFDFNTVVSSANISQLMSIGLLALSLGASTWHVFEYDATGPNTSRHKEELSLKSNEFLAASGGLVLLEGSSMRLDIRTQDSRVGEGAYFFVNDAGIAWAPTGQEGLHHRYGHIVRDRELVLKAYDNHLRAFWEKFGIE